MQDLQALLSGIVQKNEEAASWQVKCYYLQRTSDLLIKSWVWVYLKIKGDQLANHKLALEWAGPYIYKSMAKIAQIDGNGPADRGLMVHATKVCLYKSYQARH